MIYTQGCAVLQTAYPGLCSDGSFRALAPLGLSPQSRYLSRLIKNFYIILKHGIIQTILMLKQENNGLLQNFQVLQQPHFCNLILKSVSADMDPDRIRDHFIGDQEQITSAACAGKFPTVNL